MLKNFKEQTFSEVYEFLSNQRWIEHVRNLAGLSGQQWQQMKQGDYSILYLFRLCLGLWLYVEEYGTEGIERDEVLQLCQRLLALADEQLDARDLGDMIHEMYRIRLTNKRQKNSK